jgi:hypothetical protein
LGVSTAGRWPDTVWRQLHLLPGECELRIRRRYDPSVATRRIGLRRAARPPP